MYFADAARGKAPPLNGAAVIVSYDTKLLVLIRYHFDYESAQIWRSEVRETSRHDPSALQPWQVFEGTTWAESVLRHVVPAQAEAGANLYAAVQSSRRPETRPHVVSSGYDPYRNSGFCAPEVLKHVAG